MQSFQKEGLCVTIENTWSNDYFIGLKGWVLSKLEPITGLYIDIDDSKLLVENFQPRPDVIQNMPDYYPNLNCGFQVQIPRAVKHRPVFNATIGSKIISIPIEPNKFKPITPQYRYGGGLFTNFQQMVNSNKLDVLEIGSRIVSPGSQSKRCLFPDASSYTGFDIYPDKNTDVVGDAHKISSYFGDKQFGAVFSISVFEHLAMPWKVALEINKLLKIGGVSFHQTHFAWPLHDAPWDFYRFSDNGLKTIFSAPMGFEIIDYGYWSPLRMHLDEAVKGQELFPLAVSFGGVGVLARKISNYNSDKIKWDVDISVNVQPPLAN